MKRTRPPPLRLSRDPRDTPRWDPEEDLDWSSIQFYVDGLRDRLIDRMAEADRAGATPALEIVASDGAELLITLKLHRRPGTVE